MCCDWFDVVMAFAAGFLIGAVGVALLVMKIMQEGADTMNLQNRTLLKDQHCQ